MIVSKDKRNNDEDFRFQVLPEKQFYKLFEATTPEDMTLTWDEWRARRDALFDCLSKHWKEFSPCSYKEWKQYQDAIALHGYSTLAEKTSLRGSGDFEVGDHYFGRRNVAVSFISKLMYSVKALRVIRSYLSNLAKHYRLYTVTVVGDFFMPGGNPINFEGLLTSDEAHIVFGARDLAWYEKMAKKDPEINEWLDILLPLCKTSTNHKK